MVTLLHVRSSGLIQLISERWAPFTGISRFPYPPTLGKHHSTLGFWDWHYFILDSTYKQYRAVFVWLSLYNIMVSRFIHVVINCRIPIFWWLNNIPLCIYTHAPFSLSIHHGWTLRSFLCLICYEQYFSDRASAGVSEIMISCPLGKYPEMK